VPKWVRDYPEASGAGKVWHRAVDELERLASISYRAVEDDPRERRRPDVWLTDGHRGSLDVREPVVAVIHEASWRVPGLRALIDPAFIAALEEASRAGAEAATRVITASSVARDQVIDAYRIDPGRVDVVHHGVDTSVFRPDASGGRELVAAAGGMPDVPYVVFVSVVHPRKNIAALRGAMAELAGEGYPHQLVLVAAPPADRSDAFELLAAAEAPLPGTGRRVTRMTGLPEAHVAAVIAGSAAFCLPSLMEGFGLTALEAMACGVPVVVSDRGSLPEVVGNAGLVVPPTTEAVTGALRRIFDDDGLAAALRVAGRNRSLEFSWERTAVGWLEALDRAAGGR
jgi:alpha-1,3-rhamnosyl/mannosyltransferase